MTAAGSRRRLTYRWRLTIAFGAIAFGAGALVITLLYLFMRYVPTYLIADAEPIAGVPVTPAPAPSAPIVPDSVPATAFPITDAASILETLLWAGVAILVLLSALAAWGGWIVAGRMLKPLARIGVAAHRAGEGALDHRISLQGPHDEIRDLADTFDHTLDRLQRAFTAHERFAANAAHELRTPLTATKTLLDVARAHPDAVDQDAMLERIRRNNDRSIDLVQTLLALTSIEASQLSCSRIDLADLVREAVDRLDALRDDDPVLSVHLDPAPIEAEPVLAALVVENLVQNAVRHNDERGIVRISTMRDGDQVLLHVENTGSVIAADEIPLLTEPLHRARRAAGGGHGLGLAIVQSVAEAHDAELLLVSRSDGGLIATVTFPVAPDER